MIDLAKIFDDVYLENKEAIDLLMNVYDEKEAIFHRVGKNIFNLLNDNAELKQYIHSVKFRIKERDHFKDKLVRKAIELKEEDKSFDITPDNLYEKIQDFVGIRILHIHSDQITDIKASIMIPLAEDKYQVIEGPIANTWDVDYKKYYEDLGITAKLREDMYTSIHYVISVNNIENTPIELQIRTLMEELWGEVSHKINYPYKSDNELFQDQIKILARITSAGTRLVDSIFKTHLF